MLDIPGFSYITSVTVVSLQLSNIPSPQLPFKNNADTAQIEPPWFGPT
jgi:hypothetical protein